MSQLALSQNLWRDSDCNRRLEQPRCSGLWARVLCRVRQTVMLVCDRSLDGTMARL